MATILIAGGSGLIGTALQAQFSAAGHEVRLLTRRVRPGFTRQYAWNPAQGEMDESALHGVDYLINLAGAGIADKRWSPSRKRELIDSRVQSNHTLARALQRSGLRPAVFVAASAVGYYGNSREQLMEEHDQPVDQSFMVECCRLWEESAGEVAQYCKRSCVLRIGVVMSKEGGAFREFARPMRFGLGAWFGDGSAWMPWIHIGDLCRMFAWALEHQQASGVYNAVAPNPVRGKALSFALRKALKSRALLLPVPEIFIKIAFGEMSAVLLNSNKISAARIQKAGFTFDFPMLEPALEDAF